MEKYTHVMDIKNGKEVLETVITLKDHEKEVKEINNRLADTFVKCYDDVFKVIKESKMNPL